MTQASVPRVVGALIVAVIVHTMVKQGLEDNDVERPASDMIGMGTGAIAFFITTEA